MLNIEDHPEWVNTLALYAPHNGTDKRIYLVYLFKIAYKN